MKLSSWICALVFSASAKAHAQPPEDSAESQTYRHHTVQVVPAAHYKAGWIRRHLSGSLWRGAWTTPLEVEVLDLKAFAGGLVPDHSEDSTHSQVLIFRGQDGHRYRFRSLDRDFKMALPPDLRQSFVYEISKDMVCSANPLAPVMAALFLDAVGVLHTAPHVTVLPDDERLGSFRSDFAGTLGTLESDQAEGPSGWADYASSDRTISTTELLDLLLQNNDDAIDAASFLKIRLLDIYLGDWSRDRDGWRWAKVQQAGLWVWTPMAHEYDWAFARYDGLFPWAMTKLVPQVSSFGADFPRISNLVWEGREIDQRILVALDKAEWDSVTAMVVAAITDSLIQEAVGLLPSETQTGSEGTLERDLKSRRSKLYSASQSYYELLSGHVNIRASAKPERAEIRRLDDHQVEVQLYRRIDSLGDSDQKPLYRRVFDDAHTEDVRVYLLGGDDIARVDGEVDQSLSVRVVGGDGEDWLIDQSMVKGKPRSKGAPTVRVERKTHFYDSDPGTKFEVGQVTRINHDADDSPTFDLQDHETPPQDWGKAWKFEPWIGYNSDDGLSVGGGAILYKYGFRADPYVYRMQLRGQFMSGPQKFRGQYAGDFLQLLKGTHVFVNVSTSQRDIDNYFGLGNEAARDQKIDDDGGYEVEKKKFLFRSMVEVPAFTRAKVLLGTSVKNVYARGEGNAVLDTASVIGEGSVWMWGADAELFMETRDHPTMPTRGVVLHLQGSYVPVVSEKAEPFGKARAEARAYVTGRVVAPATLAVRVAGERVWGRYPYYEGATIGGTWTVRGFDRDRFTGDASVIGNAELRLLLARPHFPAYGVMGISLFGDMGRVFVSGEDSQRWHHSVGAGLWSSFIKPAYTFSATVARSVEKTTIQTYVGFMF
jgi:hypothetical protein